MPRKKKRVLNQEERRVLYELSRFRIPIREIALTLKWNETDLEEAIKKDDSLRRLVDEGRAFASSRARQTLFLRATMEHDAVETITEDVEVGKNEQGMPIFVQKTKTKRWKTQPDMGALRFWLQTQEGFKITDIREHTGKDGAPIQTHSKVLVVHKDPSREEILREIAATQARLVDYMDKPTAAIPAPKPKGTK